MAAKRRSKKTTELEAALLADSRKLRGVDLRMLGFYGGAARNGAITLSHTLDDEELEPFYEEESERAAAERKARLLAGAVWKCSSLLIEGLFHDIHELRDIEYENEAGLQPVLRAALVREDSSVLHRLPPAYAASYTAEFAQKFLVILADLATKLAGRWTPPSCLAQELAVHCLADLVQAYGDAEGLDLDDDVEGLLYEALLEDTDHLFLYPSASIEEFTGLGAKEMVSSLSAVGVAELDFNEWFEPFSKDRDRAVAAYVNYEGYRPRNEHEDDADYDLEDGAEPDASEEIAPSARAAAIAASDLIDLSGKAEDFGFNCPVAITRSAYRDLLGEGYDESGLNDADEMIDRVLGDAARAAAERPLRASAMFVLMSPFTGTVDRGPSYFDVVAGSAGGGEAVVTIQLNKTRR